MSFVCVCVCFVCVFWWGKGIPLTGPRCCLADPDRESRAERLSATGKYDKKAIRARLDLESWVDVQLQELLGPDADEVDLDLDEVGRATSKALCGPKQRSSARSWRLTPWAPGLGCGAR
jgi:hypothetical protein